MQPKYKVGDLIILKAKDAILNSPTLYKFYMGKDIPGQEVCRNEYANFASENQRKSFIIKYIHVSSFDGYLYQLAGTTNGLYNYIDENWIAT